jgi:hypothetical protein
VNWYQPETRGWVIDSLGIELRSMLRCRVESGRQVSQGIEAEDKRFIGGGQSILGWKGGSAGSGTTEQHKRRSASRDNPAYTGKFGHKKRDRDCSRSLLNID